MLLCCCVVVLWCCCVVVLLCCCVVVLFLLLLPSLTRVARRSREVTQTQRSDSSRPQKGKLPWRSSHAPHSSSPMQEGGPRNTELFGCCPLPSKERALSYSFVRGAPLQAVFRSSLGALSFSTRAPHFQHHLICPSPRVGVSSRQACKVGLALPASEQLPV